MLVTADAAINIKSSSEAIWDYATDPDNWSASNPDEHFGLEIQSEDNRPRTGAKFHQRESVAGVYADLRGHFLHVVRPKIAVWRGVAAYKVLGGLIRPRIPEGGVVKLEKAEEGVRLSHTVYMDFPDTLFGRIVAWFFQRRDGQNAVHDHTHKELVFFKKQLEGKG
jgi:hypothetical protein